MQRTPIHGFEPILKSSLKPLEHLFSDASDVSKLTPSVTSQFLAGPSISTINSSTKPSLSGIFPGDAVCKDWQFVSAGSWSLNP